MATGVNKYTLEDLLLDDIGGDGKPLSIKLSVLKAITNNFSEKNIIGSGGYGTVYKGVLGEGEFVAVKKLYSHHAIDCEPFQREVDCMMRIRHRNIVSLVGYCDETRTAGVLQKEKRSLFLEQRDKLLCFEYVCNGSLRKHLSAKPSGFQWRTCYQIIKGICQGLHYLHEKHIIHLDLKPDNVLLDDGMVPKIADFGLSRLLSEGKSRTVTERKAGTVGYMAPEYTGAGQITVKSDIYSLGVIIKKIVMEPAQATTEDVLESWRGRLEQDSPQMRQSSLEGAFRQIETCVKISKTCTEYEPNSRPTTGEILCLLEETEAGDQSIVAATPAVVEQTSSLSRLMNSLQNMCITSVEQPSTRGEGSRALVPTALPEDTESDKSFWLDTTSSTRCYMLSSRSLKIAWAETPEYWKWITLPNSRFAECAELLNVYFLAVTGEIPIVDLTPRTSYAVYLVYKLTAAAAGLDGVQTALVRLYGERVVATNKVTVNPAWGGSAAGVAGPVERGGGGGWMELKLAEFTTDERLLGERAVIVDFREENDHVRKSGLIIEGMEFRPSN